MTDFSPQNVKVAAKRVAAQLEDGTFSGITLGNGDLETTAFGCIVRVTVYADGGEHGFRVIDQNGRHWFPDTTA